MEVIGGESAEAIERRLPASTTGGGIGTEQRHGGNRGGVHRRAAQGPCRQRQFLELAVPKRKISAKSLEETPLPLPQLPCSR